MLPSKYDTKCYSPFLVIPPPPFFFYLSFFFFLIIFIIAKSYIFFIGSDETGSDRVFRNSNRNVSLLYMYICDIYIFSFFFVVNFYDGWIYIYIYRNIEFLGCTFFPLHGPLIEILAVVSLLFYSIVVFSRLRLR